MCKIVNQVLQALSISVSKLLRANSSIEKQFVFLSCLLKMCAFLVSHMTHTASHPVGLLCL